jgi:hypothetical protein
MATDTFEFTGDPIEKNFSMTVGDSFSKIIRILEDGVAKDLTNYTAELEIATSPAINKALSIVALDGKINLVLDPADTDGFCPGEYEYGIEYKLLSGPTVVDRKEIFHGIFELNAQRVT